MSYSLDTSGAVDRSWCERLDARDPLADRRRCFRLPDDVLYFDGNSLGPLTHEAAVRARAVTEQQWATDLVSAWNRHDWIDLPSRVGERLAPLIGARPDEAVVCDSVSVNLFKLLAAAVDMRPGRPAIVMQADHFPTDLYIAEGLVATLGTPHEVRLAPVESLASALGDDVAAVCLSHVDFRSGRLEKMAEITRQIQDAGALAVWDLSHSAGALDVDLSGSGVDFAVGCGYKFLNGGPGAPSFLYVARRHQEHASTPLRGWLGHRDPFAFETSYRPAAGIQRFVCGTPPILSLATLEASLEVFSGVEMASVRSKSIALGDLFLRLVEQRCRDFDLRPIGPLSGHERGSQVTLRHPEAYAIMQALIHRRVIGDFRAPDLLRFGLTPLYQRFTDVWDAVAVLRDVMSSRIYLEARFQHRQEVT